MATLAPTLPRCLFDDSTTIRRQFFVQKACCVVSKTVWCCCVVLLVCHHARHDGVVLWCVVCVVRGVCMWVEWWVRVR